MSRLALAAMVVVLLLGSLAVTSCALFGKKETVVTINEVPSSVKVAIDNGWQHHQVHRENRIWRQSYL